MTEHKAQILLSLRHSLTDKERAALKQSKAAEYRCGIPCRLLVLYEKIEASFLIIKLKHNQEIVLILKMCHHFIIESHNQPESEGSSNTLTTSSSFFAYPFLVLLNTFLIISAGTSYFLDI